MARIADPQTLDRIIDSARSVFIADGYRHARVDVIAQLAGVSVGAVYRYVEGKEALFELVLRRVAGDPTVVAVPRPFRAGRAPALVTLLRGRLTESAPFARLRAAANTDPPADAAGEFEDIVRAIYQWYLEYGDALSLIARCARDRPDLAAMDHGLRHDLHTLLTRYVARRMTSDIVRRLPDADLAAWVLAMNCAALAAEREASRSVQATEDSAEATLIGLMSSAFLV